MIYFKKNFGYGSLASLLTAGASSLTVNSGHNFSITTTDKFKLIIWDAATYPNPADDPNLEIVTANYSGTLNVYTITRAEESTTAVSHAAGSSCAMTITAGLINDEIKGFASYDNAFTYGTVYKASSDGIVVASVIANDTPQRANIRAFTDAINPPTTEIGGAGMWYDSAGSPPRYGRSGTVSFPVVKGQYWKIELLENFGAFDLKIYFVSKQN